jgi:tetratricopeptide (TPR) repeat protein
MAKLEAHQSQLSPIEDDLTTNLPRFPILKRTKLKEVLNTIKRNLLQQVELLEIFRLILAGMVLKEKNPTIASDEINRAISRIESYKKTYPIVNINFSVTKTGIILNRISIISHLEMVAYDVRVKIKIYLIPDMIQEHFERKTIKEGFEDYDKAISLLPSLDKAGIEHAVLLNNKAWLHHVDQNYQDALNLHRTASALKANDEYILYGIGLALYHIGITAKDRLETLDSALGYLTKAIALNDKESD